MVRCASASAAATAAVAFSSAACTLAFAAASAAATCSLAADAASSALASALASAAALIFAATTASASAAALIFAASSISRCASAITFCFSASATALTFAASTASASARFAASAFRSCAGVRYDFVPFSSSLSRRMNGFSESFLRGCEPGASFSSSMILAAGALAFACIFRAGGEGADPLAGELAGEDFAGEYPGSRGPRTFWGELSTDVGEMPSGTLPDLSPVESRGGGDAICMCASLAPNAAGKHAPKQLRSERGGADVMRIVGSALR